MVVPTRLGRTPLPVLAEGMPMAVGTGQAGLFLVAHEREDGPPVLQQIDLESRQLVARWELDEEATDWAWTLLPSDGNPVLLYDGQVPGAWRVDSDTAALEALPSAPLEQLDDIEGVVQGDRALVLARPQDSSAHGTALELYLLALAQGTVERAPFADSLGVTHQARALVADGSGVALTVESPRGLLRVLLDFEGEAQGFDSLPYAPGEHGAIGLEGGLLALPWNVGTTLLDPWQTTGLSLYDPARSTWALADQPCGDDLLAPVTWPLEVDGAAWLVEASLEGDGLELGGSWLTRVRVDGM